jgi:hypothetical protein
VNRTHHGCGLDFLDLLFDIGDFALEVPIVVAVVMLILAILWLFNPIGDARVLP